MPIEVSIMEEVTTFESSAASESDQRAAVAECLRRIDSAREQITRDQADIDVMQSETRAILERLRTALPAA